MSHASIPADGLVIDHATVIPEWIDYNGHMNVAYYIKAFELGIDSYKAVVGMTLPIARERTEGKTAIFVGMSRFTEKLGLSTKELKHGAFRMASGKDWLALLGADGDVTADGSDGGAAILRHQRKHPHRVAMALCGGDQLRHREGRTAAVQAIDQIQDAHGASPAVSGSLRGAAVPRARAARRGSDGAAARASAPS